MSDRRPRRLLAALAVLALLVGACSAKETKEDEVRDALAVARAQATGFVYLDERPDRTVEVQGVIEDDFRVKAAVSIDGQPAYEQIVLDDTLAVRFLDPNRLRTVLSPRAAQADLETDLEGFTSLDVLRSGRWVVDTDAAPLVTAASTQVEDLGVDPVLDALGVTAYVARAARDSVSVDEYSEDSLDPTYPSSEDVFPVPDDDSGVTRYDLRRPDLPAISSNTGDAQGIALPNARHFRKMAIYVKDGEVIEVIERIEATGKRLGEFIEYTQRALVAFNFDEAYIEEFEVLIAQANSDEEIAEILFAAMNTALVSIGQDPIVRRVMTVSFPDAGGDEIVLPTENTVMGSLDALAASAEGQRALRRQEEEGREADLTGDDDTADGADSADGGDPATTDSEPTERSGEVGGVISDGGTPETTPATQPSS